MKNFKTVMRSVFFTIFVFYGINSFAVDPPITNNLINLSNELPKNGFSVPEMVIEGNIVHTIWVTRGESNSETYLYYRRSIDLGKTWESPQKIYDFEYRSLAESVTSRRLAVSGNNVFISFCDRSDDSRIGSIYFASSTNSGANFSTPKKIVSGDKYEFLQGSFIRTSGNNIAIAYEGSNAKKGVHLLFSSNGGSSFQEKEVTGDSNTMCDFLYVGNQLIVVHQYTYYSYGLAEGRVYVSVSNNNGASFTTNKISVSYTTNNGETEVCVCYHNNQYVPKVAKYGNNIHVIFVGVTEEDGGNAILYARSTNNGQSFEKAVDINQGKVDWSVYSSGNGCESVVAKNGNVYMEYVGYKQGNSPTAKVYIVSSENNGSSLSEPMDLLTENADYLKKTYYPQLVIDPSDETGKTVYFGGKGMLSRKSVDGGKTFFGSQYIAPFWGVSSSYLGPVTLKVDNSGKVHWIGIMKFSYGSEYDIYYGQKKVQPESGDVNKALSIETDYYTKELVIVPSSPSITFESTMTGEAWVKSRDDYSGDDYSDRFNVFGKVNGGDSYSENPSGYQITFFKYGHAPQLYTGIETDKGQFYSKSDKQLDDNLWHHVAFTYDADAGLNNFKTYFDGLLVKEQTVIGKIIGGDGMLMIGSRSSFKTSNIMVDNIRLWDRALSQEEILANQTKTFTGNEEGLKLFLNFDDTFKDISGNGNDAIPLYLGELQESDFDPPKTNFETYQVTNEISFNNKTENATSYLWDFGNDEISELGNPKHTYTTLGEYNISLLAENNNSVTAAVGNVTIAGLDRIEPTEAGNLGYATISVFGGGLSTENTTFLLRKDGEDDIIGEKLTSARKSVLAAFFDVYEKSLGKWDVIVSKNGIEMKLPEVFTIVPGVEAEPWLNVSGRGQVLFNMWQTYTINFGNNGNVVAFSVPIWLAFTNYPELEVEFLDFEVVVPELANEKGIADEIKALGYYFETDNVLGESMDAKVFPFMIPVLPANSSYSVRIRIKTPGDLKIKSWMNPPWAEYAPDGDNKSALLTKGKLKLKAAECAMAILGKGIIDIGTSAIPVVGCIWSVGKLVHEVSSTPPDKFSFWGTLWNTVVTTVDCGLNISGIGAVYKGFGVFFANMHGYGKGFSDCYKILSEISTNEIEIGAVSSFDPNEMIGPSGFGNTNYIKKQNIIPYTVLFENKSEATAPAHIVTITDTLDLEKFDITKFGFSSFGWGDSIYTPPGNESKEFSVDVDMRSEINLITRVSGKLDTINGVVKWEFLSLNPETMNLEEDPFIGFLPPNNSSPEGEGFVSFFVGLQEELETNTQIKNMATIVFDANKPIFTNEYVNTLDLDYPTSKIYALDETTPNGFTLNWTGLDNSSGIKGYNIYVLENDTLRPWLVNTQELSAIFKGTVGETYKFYSVAIDNVHRIEYDPAQYDAITKLTVDAVEIEMIKEGLMVYPNPTNDFINIKITNPPCNVFIVEIVGINGSVNYSEIFSSMQIQGGININVTNFEAGQYIVKVIYGNENVVRKIIVQ